MRRQYLLTIAFVAMMLIVGAATFGTDGSLALQTVSGDGPSAADVQDCNQYARWIADRHESNPAHEAADAADERVMHGALLGTLTGLAEGNRNSVRAKAAYRLCMVRRGYKAWG